MTHRKRRSALAAIAAAAVLASGCAGGPPRHVPEAKPQPPAPAPEAPEREPGVQAPRLEIPVRIGLHWDGVDCTFGSYGSFELSASPSSPFARSRLRASIVAGAEDGTFRVVDEGGSTVWQGRGPLRVEARTGHLQAGDLSVRGSLEISARRDSLFVVNVVPLEDYLRGVVPLEIGPRPVEDLDAVAAQAVAARTYTARRLEQYNSLPFDLFASVQDQVYAGVEVENEVADEAIRNTRGMVLADGNDLIEAFYSSTCGGKRSDIAAVWPHREVNRALRGGSDGRRGREWCRSSSHFEWKERWTGRRLSELVRRHLPAQLELAPGSVPGELVDLKVVKRGPSGRIAMLEYRTSEGAWRVPGDRNRWILRRPDGSILRSVLVELDVRREGGRVVEVVAAGRGNGHGVGMCQVGALGRSEAGYAWWEILGAYYPGAKVRPLRPADLPPGRDTGA